MVKVEPKYKNRVITVSNIDSRKLDKKVSELLDIIDQYGGTNPYPRFFVNGYGTSAKYYSCTTKIGLENENEFDQEIEKWRGRK